MQHNKKKRHTLKSQVVVERSLKIICTAHGVGREHDFRLFKRSQVRHTANVEVLADKGYQGVAKCHPHSRIPKKKSKGVRLSDADKLRNRELARVRVICEHVIGKLKVFKILAELYRNRRRRFGLRFNLIATLYNFELSLSTI